MSGLEYISPDEDKPGYILKKVDNETYIIVDSKNRKFKVNIPRQFHYSIGDEVLDRHIYNQQCMTCGNDKMYNQQEEVWYCPLGHDNS